MEQSFMKNSKILPLVLKMSLPMVISMLINSLYNIVDSYFVAQISEDAMTALSLVFPLQNAANAVGIGFGVGINAAVAYFLGAVSLGVMLIGTLLCLVIPRTLMGLFTQSPSTIAEGASALRIISAGFIVSALSVVISGTFEGLGKGIPSLVISLLRYVAIVPIALLLSMPFGAAGVWNAFWLTELISAAASCLLFIFVYVKPKNNKY